MIFRERTGHRAVFRWAFAVLSLLLAAWPRGAPAQDQAPAWEIVQGESRVIFTGRGMGAPVRGQFSKLSGDIRFDPESPAAARAEIVVDMASVQAANADVQEGLKSEEWFNVAAYPTARFETSTFRRVDGGRYQGDGTLTLRGVTKDVTLPFTLSVEEAPSGDALIAKAEGEVQVSRLAFGIGQGEWQATDVVADEVVIRIEVTARRPK